MLIKENSVLVVVDVQGRLATLMHEAETLSKHLVAMVKGARELSLPILWVEQIPEKLGPTVPELTKELEGLQPISKKTFSCYRNQEFVDALQATGRHQVLVVGIEAHICVYQTARHLHEAGFEVELVVDAVSSRTLENKNIALEKLSSCGVSLTSVEMALFELMETAEAPEFRTVAGFIK
ncbi:MAG: hydrolase [Endozoicomonas sp.]